MDLRAKAEEVADLVVKANPKGDSRSSVADTVSEVLKMATDPVVCKKLRDILFEMQK